MTILFLLAILVSGVLPAPRGILPNVAPPTRSLASQEPPASIVELWDGQVFVGEPFDEDTDSLTLQTDQFYYRIDKLDIRSIFRQDRDITGKYLKRKQINASAVRAIYSGYKNEIGMQPIGVYDPTRKVTLYLSTDDVRRGKVLRIDQSSLTLKTFFGKANIPRKYITRARQGRTDVSVTFLTEERLIRYVGKAEDPYKLVKAVAKTGLSAAAIIVMLAALPFVLYLLFFGALGGG